MFLDDDHVVPDQLMLGHSASPAPNFIHSDTVTTTKVDICQSQNDDSDLWAAIEDVLELSNVSQPQLIFAPKPLRNSPDVIPDAHAQTQKKRPDNLKLEPLPQTPNFELLINTDTPEPISPGTHEVPFNCTHRTEGAKHGSVSMTLQSGCTTATTVSYSTQQHLTQSLSDIIKTSPPSSRTSTPLTQYSYTSQTFPSVTQAPTDVTSGVISTPSGVTRTSLDVTPQSFQGIISESLSVASNNQPIQSGTSGSGLMESLFHIRSSLLPDYGSFDVYGGVDMMEDPDAFIHGGTSGVVLEERIKHACTLLDIPMDPNSWTIDQVQKWAMFVLKSYDGHLIDPDTIMALTVDGATLTTMTKEDLINYFPNVGETLYNELEVWCFGLTSTFSNALVPQSPIEPAYIDLDNLSKNTYHDISMTSSGMPPLQPITSANMMMTSSSHASAASPAPDSILLPSVCSLMPRQATIKQEHPDMQCGIYIKQEIKHEHLTSMHHNCGAEMSPVSSPDCGYGTFGSISCSPGSTSSGHSSPGNIFDEHELTRHMLPPRSHAGKHTIQLWQFLKDLLLQPQYESYIRWLDRGKGIFKIEDSAHVAKLWGRRKNRPAMNYDKLSRSIRQYYKKGIIKKTSQSKRLVYQFCPQYNG